MKRKILTCALALCMVVALFGCGKKKEVSKDLPKVPVTEVQQNEEVEEENSVDKILALSEEDYKKEIEELKATSPMVNQDDVPKNISNAVFIMTELMAFEDEIDNNGEVKYPYEGERVQDFETVVIGMHGKDILNAVESTPEWNTYKREDVTKYLKDFYGKENELIFPNDNTSPCYMDDKYVYCRADGDMSPSHAIKDIAIYEDENYILASATVYDGPMYFFSAITCTTNKAVDVLFVKNEKSMWDYTALYMDVYPDYSKATVVEILDGELPTTKTVMPTGEDLDDDKKAKLLTQDGNKYYLNSPDVEYQIKVSPDGDNPLELPNISDCTDKINVVYPNNKTATVMVNDMNYKMRSYTGVWFFGMGIKGDEYYPKCPDDIQEVIDKMEMGL